MQERQAILACRSWFILFVALIVFIFLSSIYRYLNLHIFIMSRRCHIPEINSPFAIFIVGASGITLKFMSK